MPTAYRKHPLSFAISMSLFAAMATSAMAAPPSGDQADKPDAQTATTQSAPAPDSSQKQPDEKKQSKKGENRTADEPNVLSVVEVIGVRASQMRAIELKRTAQDIQDSITAESIGQLPDVTLTDALQRITGVQIN